MVGYFISLIAAWVYYSRSRYFPPSRGWRLPASWPRWLGVLLILLAACVYVAEWDWAVGILIWMVAVPAAFCSVVYLFNIQQRYALFWLAVLAVFLIIDLVN
ncbi:MAG: hypothetical protein EAS52_19795 [Parapedobacter sp.]|nr:MAG: hypothetical protein EAS52_19795 [Parapedobacter sp.]